MLACMPTPPSLQELGPKLKEKATLIAETGGQADFADDLAKWLGERSTMASRSSARCDRTQVATGLNACVAQLQAAHQEASDGGDEADVDADSAVARRRRMRP